MKRKRTRKSKHRKRTLLYIAIAAVVIAVVITSIIAFQALQKTQQSEGIPVYLGSEKIGYISPKYVAELNSKVSNAIKTNASIDTYKDLYYTLANAEVNSGIAGYAFSVPHIVVVSNYTIKAVVIGEITSKTFWNNITSSTQRIIMFGRTTCPHCHNMYEFFNKYYKNMTTFIWLDAKQ
ncbi:hypothetical protein QPL79_07755 [Ignisphaera sp. 4213-co]|uniref:Thioredoxin n=1 Tax=Ignisphaera cupida TaxID=3050454 RepID=A0ABD4Z7C6_9CREN|nr:hypothetical protein [Ignisphaera sp. 4213-co]MDK6029257.1 hypothetical protein [Ignisphaera sp. 4213-co]